MEEWEKIGLRGIVNNIPHHELNMKVSDLWKKYGLDFNYHTFRRYFKALRRE